MDGFRADPAAVYAFVGGFFEALATRGVEHVCVSPGSRSTPLTIAADRVTGLRTWVGLDERASSFFALGLAKASGRPVALVCTSGTAAANYLPAVIEAHYSGVPLLLLTADRPPELRDWGAGQTIDQPGLYGGYPRWTFEVPMAEPGEAALRLAAQLGARAVDEATGFRAGPVHLNWPFREPLEPPTSTETVKHASVVPRTPPSFSHASRVAAEADVAALVELANAHERGVICAGPMDPDEDLCRAIVAFARASGWPVLADPASQLRGVSGERESDSAPILSMGDAFLRAPAFADRMRPEVVVRLGQTPVSKTQRLWLEACEPATIWWLDEGGQWGEPSYLATHVVRGGAAALLDSAAVRVAERPANARSWCEAFEAAELRSRAVLDDFAKRAQETEALSGVVATRIASRGLPAGATVFASNSMSIRFLDVAHVGSTSGSRVLCSRGASGIDGINSTALGIAAATDGPTLLLTGDLAFLHDLSGLLVTKQARFDLTILVLDDDGGGIFSFLPVAAQGDLVDFERLFGTPHGLDLGRVAALFDFDYARAVTPAELEGALRDAQATPGVSLVHVPLGRAESEAQLRELLGRIASEVDGGIPTKGTSR